MTKSEFYAEFRDAHGALHRRWTAAVDQPGYVKSDWILLEQALSSFGRHAARTVGIAGHEPILRLEP